MRSHFIISLLTGAAMATPAFAAEPGTYRPGTPYYSSEAGSADICENQCSGDAQCRGWNFVKVSPQATSGVCEFNSTSASPVPSPVSVSGDNDGRSYARSVSVGGTNTVRVGAPTTHASAVKPVPARTAPRKVTQSNTETLSPNGVRPGARAIRPGQNKTPTRRVVRQPIPQTLQPGTATYRQPAGRPVRNVGIAPQRPIRTRPQFQHNLDEGRPVRVQRTQTPSQQRLMRSQPRPQARPVPNANMGDPRLQHMLRQQAAQPRPAAAPTVAPNPASIPPQMPAQGTPVSAAPATPSAAPPPLRPQSMAEAEQSLFGSLHDDVIAPKPISPAVAANPDAPIATAQAVPVKKVTVENLLGLAGGPSK